MAPLPTFRYHPDPLDTGSVETSDAECVCCGESRGYIYAGPVFSEEEVDPLCPWCIASGEAHERFDASFVDEEGIGGYGDWDEVPQSVIEEVAYRTPSFSGWQQERWFTCCGDAAQFLGPAGKRELAERWPDATAPLRDELEDPEVMENLKLKGSPVAFVFRCAHCGAFGGYIDFD